MARLRTLFTALAWQQLVPDQNHAIVTGGYGEGLATVATAQSSDKRLLVSYVPATGTEPQELTVDLGQFAGPVSARWFNPARGGWTSITGAPLPNRGTHSFPTPGDNGTQTNDWLLVLEAR